MVTSPGISKRVWGLGFRVPGLGFRVQGLGFGVWGLGLGHLRDLRGLEALWGIRGVMLAASTPSGRSCGIKVSSVARAPRARKACWV